MIHDVDSLRNPFSLLENILIEAEVSRDQVDWMNSLKEKLTQV